SFRSNSRAAPSRQSASCSRLNSSLRRQVSGEWSRSLNAVAATPPNRMRCLNLSFDSALVSNTPKTCGPTSSKRSLRPECDRRWGSPHQCGLLRYRLLQSHHHDGHSGSGEAREHHVCSDSEWRKPKVCLVNPDADLHELHHEQRNN